MRALLIALVTATALAFAAPSASATSRLSVYDATMTAIDYLLGDVASIPMGEGTPDRIDVDGDRCIRITARTVECDYRISAFLAGELMWQRTGTLTVQMTRHGLKVGEKRYERSRYVGLGTER